MVALTSISTIKVSSPKLITNSETTATTTTTTPLTTAATVDSQQTTLSSTTVLSTSQSQPINSLVVSVPLTSTSISPHNTPINNQTSVLANTIMQERSCGSGSVERTTPLSLGGKNICLMNSYFIGIFSFFYKIFPICTFSCCK